jgi:glycosyltransferase involved in cell wall biosynthesis
MKARKRILFFVPLPPPVTGAALRNKSLVDSAVLRESYVIEVIPFNFADSIESIGHFSMKKGFKGIVRFFEIFIKVVRFRPHLVYFNFSLYGFALFRDTIYVALFKLLRCRLLFHLRTQGVQRQVEGSDFKKTMFKFVFRRTDVVCLSKHLCIDIKDVFQGVPFVVSNGIEDVSSRYPIAVKDPSEWPRIIFIGHLLKSKGVLDLIDALKILSGRQVSFHADIVGAEGDLKISELKAMLTHLNLDRIVNMEGVKLGDEKYKALRSADLLVLPTVWEAFPGVILEAMQFSLPVIATREGAIPEIVDDQETGLLIEKHQVAELADKLQMLIEDPALRRSLGEKGRKKFESRYVLDQFESNMKNVFDEVLGA